MFKQFNFRKSLLLLLGLAFFLTDASFLQAQSTSDGPIVFSTRVRRVYARDYDDTFGGITNAENTWKIWAQDAANLDGLGWRGGQCIQRNIGAGSFPYTSGILNTVLMTQSYGTTVPTSYQIRMDAWEDDCGSRCSYNSGFGSCGFDDDDSRCNVSNFAGNINFRNNLPGQWTNNGWFFACGGNYGVEMESRWYYSNGNTRSNAINLGNTNCDPRTFTDLNATTTYSNASGSPRGSRDVYYVFTVNQPSDVTITTCGPNTNFDTYLYLLNSGGGTITSNDDWGGCNYSSLQSRIVRTINPGTYYVLVEAFSSSQSGVFNLSVDIQPQGGNVSINGLPSSTCLNGGNISMSGSPSGGTFSGPGVSGSTFNPAAAGVGTHTVNYSVPSASNYTLSTIGFSNSNISGGTSVSLGDDAVSSARPIGFPFEFYGNTYSNFYISSNGFISFTSNGSGCCTGQNLPNPTNPDNLVALFWEDLDPGNGNGPNGGQGYNRIGYRTLGSPGSRVLVVSYNRVEHWPSGNLVSGQIKLYEGTNIVETHIQYLNSDGGTHTTGIENANGSLALQARRSTASLSNWARRYTPPSACAGQTSQQITVLPVPDASFSGLPGTICANAPAITLVPGTSGGTFSGPGISGTTFNPAVAGTGTHTITYSITSGGCSNSSTRTVTVNAAATVSFTGLASSYCPSASNVTLTGSPSGGTFSGPGVIGNTFSPTSAGVGTHTITYSFTNRFGCVSTTSQTTTVSDNQAPNAICRNITVNLNASGNASITAGQVNNNSTDNCGITSLAVTPSSFTCGNVGNNTVTLTVADGSGNTDNCTATVTVRDVTNPTALCRNRNISLNASGNASVTAAQINNGSSDACGIASLNLSNTSFTCSNVGANTVTLTVTDNNGNTSSCNATVNVSDNTAPSAVCRNVTVNLNASGNASVTAGQIDNGSSDACGLSALAVTPSSFNCSDVGNNTVTLTVTDVNGNSSTCTGTVTVRDNTPPSAVCRNVTVQLNASGSASITPAQIDNGSSDVCGIGSLALNTTSFGCANVGNNTVTLTVTDNNGNTNSCTANALVQDNVAPNAVCQDLTVQLNASGTASITAQQVNNGSSDACGLSSIAITPSSFDCSDVGANTTTLTVQDVNGNTSTCTSNITVQDNVAPNAVCQDVTVQLNAAGNGSITTSDVNNGSSDACGIASLSLNTTSFNCSNVGANNLTLTVTDNNGNVSTCTATATVEDNVNPVAVCQDVTVQLDASGNGSITTGDVNNGSSDACGIASLALNTTSFGCANAGANSLTLTVTDNNGNVNTCSATATVVDDVDPVAVCQDVTVQLDASGNASITTGDVNNGSADACGIASISLNTTSFDCSNVGANSLTLTVTDNNGNVSTCAATATVEDNIDPNAVCQDVTVQLNAAGNGSITTGDVNNGSSDACGIASLSLNTTSFNCSNVGANSLTLTVTDNNGNVSTCTATATVEDNVNPVAVCQDVTVQLDASGNGSITTGDVNNGSSDACGIASLALNTTSFGCANVGANSLTLTVTDNNGNVNTCSATATVVDDVDPVAVCQDVTVQLDASGNGSTTTGDVNNGSSDACGIASISLNTTSFDCSNVGANSLTLTVTDNNGNVSTCTATATVEDNIDPNAVCQDVTVQLDASGNGSITAQDVNNGSNDACGIASLSVSPSTFNCSGVGGNTATLTVTDNNGNVSTCTSTVTVEDNVPPVAVCQDITVQLDPTGNVSITPADVDGGSGDACGTPALSIDINSFTCSNVGGNTVTLTATDVNGNNSNCTSTVTVVDTIPPVAVCQDVTVQLDASGNGSTTAQDMNNGSSDACGIASLSLSQTDFVCSEVGANTETLTVTDVNGNVSTCTATVTVEDNINPVAICQDVTVQLDASGNGGTTAQDMDNGSSDACGVASLSLSQTAFDCSEVGPNTETLTVTDVNGNVSTCTATVTVEDNIAPVAVCQDLTLQLDASGNASTTPQDVDNGSSDACGIASLTLDNNVFSCGGVGGNTVTLTVTDVNGNVSTCTSAITIEDNVPPVALCQDITIELDSTGAAGITTADIDNGSNDACGIDTLRLSDYGFTCSDVGSNPVTLTVTDNNGNTNNCAATVTVEDNIAPVALCQDVVVSLDALGFGIVFAPDVDNGSWDNCGIAQAVVIPGTYSCTNVGANTITLRLTDVNGNVNECQSTVTVFDQVDPVARCKDITVQLDVTGNATITPQYVNNGSTDACGIASLSIDDDAFNCSDIGQTNIVTLTVTDDNGNQDQCTSTVTVEDNVAPDAVCQDLTIMLDPTGNGSITPQDVDNGSTDACGIDNLSLDISSFNCSNVDAVASGPTPTDLFISEYVEGSLRSDKAVEIFNGTGATVDLSAGGYAIDLYFNGSATAGQTINLSGTVADGDVFVLSEDGAAASIQGAADQLANFNFTGNDAVVLRSGSTILDIFGVIGDDPGAAWSAGGPLYTRDQTLARDPNIVAGVTTNPTGTGPAAFTGLATEWIPVGPNDFSNLGTHSINSGSGPAGNPVVLTVTDIHGNISTCNSNITVLDTVDPVAVCQDITVQLDASGNASITPQDVNNGSSDACGVDSLAIDNNSFSCGVVGGNTVTLTVYDVNGNTSTCTSTVTIEDTVPPIAICQDVTVQLDATGNGSTTAQDVDNGSNDACGIASLSLSQTDFVCSEVGANTETLTVTDVNGNVSTCTATVTVEDNVDPVAICQDVTVQLDATGNGSTTPQDVDNGSNDACGIASLSLDVSSFNCSNVGSNNPVVLTVTDNNGNVSTCNATVTVEDNVPPVAICQDVTVQLDATGNGSTTAQDVDNGSNDACGIASLVLSQTNFDCSEVGPNTEVLTVTDVNGNVSTCTATVTVEDNVPPVAICQDVTVQLDASGNGSTTAQDVDNGSNDACGIASLVLSQTAFNCSEVGPNTEVLTVTDVNGNVSTCTTTVTVEDNVPPVAICQDVTVQLDATGNGSTTAQDVDNGSNDACGIASLSLSQTGFDCSEVGPNTEVLTVTDVNGNVSTCTTTVTVEDNVPPVAICQDVTVQLDATGNGSTTAQDVDNGSNDACGIASLVLSQTDFDCSEVGPNTEVLTVTDVNGNVSTCTTTVTVEDNVPPVAICQDVTVQLDASGNGSTTAQDVDNGSNDACGIASLVLSQTAFNCSEVGPNTEVLTVTDVNGNVSTCTTTVTVEDNVPPVAICQDVTVQLDATGNGSTTAQDVDNGSNDACGIASLVLSQTDFDCSEVGPNPEVLTVTDVNGNVSTCNTTVTVEDNVPPVAICQDLTINLPSSGTQTITPGQIDNGSNDACGIASLAVNPNTFDCSNQGGNAVTLTVTDVNGNVSTCSATVTVTVDPMVAAATSPTYNCGYNISCNGETDGSATVTATGGCLPYTYLWSDGQTTQTATGLAAGTYTVTVTDQNGNNTSTTITLTEPDLLVTDAGPDQSFNFGCSCADLSASAVGGCQPYTYIWSTGELTQDITVCPDTTTTYFVTVVDANGCESKDSMQVIKPNGVSQTDEYVLLAQSSVDIGSRGEVLTGAVGVVNAGGTIDIGNRGEMNVSGASWLAGDVITIGNNSDIGDIYAGGTPSIGNNVTFGSILTLPNPVAALPCEPAMPGGNDVTIPNNGTVTLSPGNYGELTVGNRANVTLLPGLYTFVDMDFGNGVNFSASTGNGSDVVIFSDGPVSFGNDNIVYANIVALGNRITFGNGAYFQGAYVANELFAGPNTTFKLDTYCWENVPCATSKNEVGNGLATAMNQEMEVNAYPNPFQDETSIQFRLPTTDVVKVEVMNMNGVLIGTLFDGEVEAGELKQVTFKPETQTAGFYFYRITTGSGLVRNGKLVYQR